MLKEYTVTFHLTEEQEARLERIARLHAEKVSAVDKAELFDRIMTTGNAGIVNDRLAFWLMKLESMKP